MGNNDGRGIVGDGGMEYLGYADEVGVEQEDAQVLFFHQAHLRDAHVGAGERGRA